MADTMGWHKGHTWREKEEALIQTPASQMYLHLPHRQFKRPPRLRKSEVASIPVDEAPYAGGRLCLRIIFDKVHKKDSKRNC